MNIIAKIGIILGGLIGVGLAAAYFSTGSGGFKRMMTLTGVYAVCKPGGYDAVCFLDADSVQGGLSCLPLSAVGGECAR
jgi:hypothetical protein